jgi:hypothetical protein
MQFLKTFLSWFTVPPTPEPHRYVTEDGNVSRFVFSARDLFADGTPKPKAFKPDMHPDLQRFETSVCGMNGVSDERLWHLGRTIRAREGKTAIAVLELPVPKIITAGLICEPAPEVNYDEHGVIMGWNPDPEAKDARLAVQSDLAAAVPASRVKRPP